MLRLLTALSFVTLALAGCAESDTAPAEDPVAVAPEDFQLASGTGAIAGLLVDDRFRPIHLTDAPKTEFQTTGFVLLQETGEQIQTTENGEFSLVDLEPGQYTLRVTANGFEATPTRVQVQEGVFNEISVVARRVLSEGGSIITEEYSAFIPCQASAFAATAQCHMIFLDQSGETNRQQFTADYTTFDTDWVVIEMKSNKEAERDGALKIVVRDGDGCYIINDSTTEGDYMRVWLKRGEVSPFDIELRNCPWENDSPMLIQVWAQGILKEETMDAVGLICLTGACAGETAESRGLGIQMGTKIQFLNSVFLGEPEVDVESYCVLC